MLRSFIAVSAPLVALACLPSTDFVRTTPQKGDRVARPASAVEVFFGTTPAKSHVRVGYFDRAPSDYVDDRAIDVVNDLRRKAGYEGCDGVVIPPKADLERLAASSTEKARAFCIMYGGQVAQAEKPAAASDEASCTANDGDACVRLGIAAEDAKSLAKAAAYYDKACKLPHQRGCTHAAILMLEGGEGVTKNEALALEMFAKACVLDDSVACRYQGLMYVEGKAGLKKGVLGGIGYLDKACQHKDGWACWRIAVVHKQGEGVPQDEARAATYMALACTNGHEAACALK